MMNEDAVPDEKEEIKDTAPPCYECKHIRKTILTSGVLYGTVYNPPYLWACDHYSGPSGLEPYPGAIEYRKLTCNGKYFEQKPPEPERISLWQKIKRLMSLKK